LVREIDQAVVAAHHLQVDRVEFLRLVENRLNHFESRAQAEAASPA
jgi:hypothetical protein